MLHPCHKLQYFKNAGWEDEWIESAEEIVRTQFLSYRSLDLDVNWSSGEVQVHTISSCHHKCSWTTALVGQRLTLWRCLIKKYIRQLTGSSSTKTCRITWWSGSVFEHWSWTCNWCARLVVWTQTYLPLPLSDGVGLFIHPRYVLNTSYVPLLMISGTFFSHLSRRWTDLQPRPTFALTCTQLAFSSVNTGTAVSWSLESDGLCEGCGCEGSHGITWSLGW